MVNCLDQYRSTPSWLSRDSRDELCCNQLWSFEETLQRWCRIQNGSEDSLEGIGRSPMVQSCHVAMQQNSDAVTLSQNGGKPFRDPSTCTHTHIPCAACASNEKFCVCEIQFPRGFLPCGCLLLDYTLFYFRDRVDQT